MPCATENTLAELIEHRRFLSESPDLAAHLAECDDCRALLAKVTLASLGGADRSEDAGDALAALEVVAPDRYDVGRELAHGGMGRILEAWDRRHGRKVAIKVLLRRGSEAVRRFVREARITARLQHPAIVPLYEAGKWTNGEPFFAMKLVEGRSLGEVIESKATLREKLALLPNVIALTEALAYAHEQRVVHRDVKPSNVLLGAFGETVLIDWGLAKELRGDVEDEESGARPGELSDDAWHTNVGRAVGSLCFMSPEQARGAPVDERTDVYALGAVLYHAFSGRPPHLSSSAKETVDQMLAGPPEPLAELVPELAPDLVAIIEKAMARDPADRYASAREMAKDLERYAAGQLVAAHSYSLAALLGRFVRRYRAAFAMVAAVLVAVGVTAGISVRRIVQERDRADALKVLADREKATAVTQRDAAEKLVGFVLGELRDRLDALGKLDLLAGIGAEVESYYRTLGPTNDAMDAASLVRRGRALDTMAAVEQKRRDWVATDRLLLAAIDVYAAALARDPSDTTTAAYLIVARGNLAATRSAAGRGADALAAGERADEEGEALARRDPSDPRAWAATAMARSVLAWTRADQGQMEGAHAAADDARSAIARVGDPSTFDDYWQERVGNAYANIGGVGTRVSDWALAQEGYGASIALRRKQLEKAPGHVGKRSSLAYALQQLGFAQENVGAHDAAFASYEEAVRIREALAAREPEDFSMQYELGTALSYLCDLEREWRGPRAAEAPCLSARNVADRVVAARPDDVRVVDMRARVLRTNGRYWLAAGRPEEAARAFEAAVEAERGAVAHDPKNTYFLASLGQGLVWVAEADLALHRLDAARARIVEAIGNDEAGLAASQLEAFEGQLGGMEVVLGDVERARGDAKAARAAYARALTRYEAAVRADDTDVDAHEGIAIACTRLAKGAPAAEAATLRARAEAEAAPLEAAGKVSPESRRRIDGTL